MQTHDYFERLGLPRRFSVDLKQLESLYLAKSRLLHPDFHSGNAENDRDTAELNSAYQTLKFPFLRAEYLLSLHGGPSASEDKSQDQIFLMEMMEIREQIENATNDSITKMKLDEQLTAQLSEIERNIATLFTKIDSAANQVELKKVRLELNSAKTVQSLIKSLNPENEI